MAEKKTRPAKKSLLVPQITSASSMHEDLSHYPKSTFEPFAGEWHLVSLDKEGNEVPGSDFSIGEHTYYQVFHVLIGKTFAVKKKANKINYEIHNATTYRIRTRNGCASCGNSSGR